MDQVRTNEGDLSTRADVELLCTVASTSGCPEPARSLPVVPLRSWLSAWHADRVLLDRLADLLPWLGLAAACYLALWPALLLLARRLPPGLLRDAAAFLPACVTTARRLRASLDVPRRAKVALLLAIAWVLSPIDLVPEFLPVIGLLDDVLAVVLLLRYATRSVPRAVVEAAWPAEPRLLGRLLTGLRPAAPR